MKRWGCLLLCLLLLAGLIGGGIKAKQDWDKKKKPDFRVAKVTRGAIVHEVKTSGTVEPILKITIGSFVSGPILDTYVDFFDQVEKDQLLARVDPRIWQAAKSRDEASLATTQAELQRVKANLQQACNNESRARKLLAINEDYISETEMDQLIFARKALDAQMSVAEQSIKQAQARLDESELNLEYTNIKAPEAGIVINRTVDPGQTLAANFQTPELFVLAPDMDKRMWVHASVVEADVGNILKAKDADNLVQFYVDAYQDTLFEGKILQIRPNPNSDQNVITYPVIVETPNPGMKLLPGMTANLSFEIERREDILRVPGAAIRYVPDEKYAREEDKKLITGEDDEQEEASNQSAKDRVEASRRRRQRHVWVVEGDNKLKAIEIEFGLSDGRFYELVKGDLTEDQELVIGLKSKK